MTPLKNRWFWGMATGAGIVVFKTGLNLIIIPILMSQLGLSLYGLFVLIIGIQEVAWLLDFGFNTAMIKLLGTHRTAENEPRAQGILAASHAVYALTSVLTLAFGYLTIPLFIQAFHIPPQYHALATAALYISIFEAAIALYTCYFRSTLLSHTLHQLANKNDFLYMLIGNSVGIVVLLCGGGLIGFLGSRLAAACIRLAVIIIETRKIEPHVLWAKAKLSWQSFKEIVSYSGHAMLVNTSVFISHKMDNFVIAWFLPLAAIAPYEIVFRMLSLALMTSSRMCEVVLPIFTRLCTLKEKVEARTIFLQLSAWAHMMVWMFMILILGYYDVLVRLISANQIPYAITLPVLAVAIPCVWSGVLQMPSCYYLLASGKEHLLSRSSIITAAANFILSVILVQKFGVLGVALGTLIPQLIQHHGHLIRLCRIDLDIPIKEYLETVMLKTFLPLAGSAITVVLLRWSFSLVHLPEVLTFAIAALGVTGVTAWLWYQLTATPTEKQWVQSAINAIKNRLHPTVIEGVANG